MANAYRLNGDEVMAIQTVNEAIRIAKERHTRIPECLARLVHGRLLLQSTGDEEKGEGAKELERAKTLMRETGAMLFEMCPTTVAMA